MSQWPIPLCRRLYESSSVLVHTAERRDKGGIRGVGILPEKRRMKKASFVSLEKKKNKVEQIGLYDPLQFRNR